MYLSKATKKFRELVSILEANDINSSNYLDNVITVFKDKSYCEDFHLYLRIFEIEKLKDNKVDIDIILAELDSKYTSLLYQNEQIFSKPTSSIDAKYIAMNAKSKAPLDQNLILQILITSLQQKPKHKLSN